MWLRDTLPKHLTGARVLIYGYDTTLPGSNSFQNIPDLASEFCSTLRIALRDEPSEARIRPLIFIAHSLGGLVLKQTLIQMASGDDVDVRNLKSTFGILFFGVPNQGMDISSLHAMVHGQHNLPFLAGLSKDAGSLQELVKSFRAIFDFHDSQIFSFYETSASPTAQQDDMGTWSMSGKRAVLVDRYSAQSGRPWEEDRYHLQSIDCDHSNMVKFSDYSDDCDIVCEILRNLGKEALAVITARLTQKASKTRNNALRRIDSTGFNIEAQILREVGLSWATLYEQNSLVHLLLEMGTDIEAIPDGSNTALHHAACIGSASLTRLLLSRGADCRKGNANGNTALHLAASFSARPFARKGAISKVLLKAGIDPWTAKDALRVQAADKKDSGAMIALLLSMGAELQATNGRNLTPLHMAANYGDEAATNVLIEHGADIEARSSHGYTPLHLAAAKHQELIIRLLLDKGANIRTINESGETVVLTAVSGPTSERVPDLMDRVPEKADPTATRLSIVQLLINRGGDLGVVDYDGWTPLHRAVDQNQIETVQLLLEKEANVFVVNEDYGWTVLGTALSQSFNEVANAIYVSENEQDLLRSEVRNSNEDTVRWLLMKGIDVNTLDDDGLTPLHLAAIEGHPDTVNLLLQFGANPLTKSPSRRTPLDYSKHYESYEPHADYFDYEKVHGILEDAMRTASKSPP